ncbi:hypothetical protein GPECTOR_591g659 [Gonium pectorale]|uniref:Uncharacterized protein n=1 Tax=Gonium pectorale TaxID=33097 RepID=A0A150FUK2_GONPE|nr:hypothetical protein GPECTOR_591g659 [Gonium pectorale]|eukprot:KXZ41266.1 hypothetical protein GPECTOR_591g659 [Gonium pectorale]
MREDGGTARPSVEAPQVDRGLAAELPEEFEYAEESADPIADLPLPGSLLNTGASPDTDSSWVVGGAGRQRGPGEPRYSEMPYMTLQGQAAGAGGAGGAGWQAGRNSDLGFYLEDARLTRQPTRGATPIRHSLLDTPLARQVEADRAAEGPAAKPATLDYTPKLRSQPSRGNNLLSQPSMRPRLLSDSPAGEGEPAPQAQRLEYVPSRGPSRRWTTAATRPLSPVKSASQQVSPAGVSRGPASSVATPGSSSASGIGSASGVGLGSGYGAVDTSGSASRRYVSMSSRLSAMAVGTASGTPSPLGSRPAVTASAVLSPQPPYDDSGHLPVGGVRSQLASQLSSRRLAVVVAEPQPLRGSTGAGMLLSAAHAHLEHRPSAPQLFGSTSPSAAASAGTGAGQPRESLRSVAWTDVLPRAATVTRGPAAAAATLPVSPSAAASRSGTGSGLLDGSGAAVGARTSRLLASLHRLGVTQPEGASPLMVSHSVAVA